MRLDFHKNHILLFGVVLGGFIALSVIIAVLPAFWVQDHTHPLPGAKPPTAQETQGLKVYLSEGCAYCHTQQVRPIPEDAPYGRPSAPGDYAYIGPLGPFEETPGVLGSERTGPDLSNVGARQTSDVWQYIHLYDPRAVVPDSIMPSFPWLFKVEANPAADAVVVPVPPDFAPANGKVVATDKAQALVAYLLSLKQAPIAGVVVPGTSQAPPAANASAPSASAASAKGGDLYTAHCAACHQANGQGLPGAFPPLAGNDVVTAADPTEHITVVLNGLQGKTIAGTAYSSPMPAFADQLSDAEIAEIINHERTSWGNSAPTVTADDVSKVRATGGKTP